MNKEKLIKRPVVVKFKRKDGSILKLKAMKIVQKPEKVVFWERKKGKEANKQ